MDLNSVKECAVRRIGPVFAANDNFESIANFAEPLHSEADRVSVIESASLVIADVGCVVSCLLENLDTVIEHVRKTGDLN